MAAIDSSASCSNLSSRQREYRGVSSDREIYGATMWSITSFNCNLQNRIYSDSVLIITWLL
ncbi:hypothetical protein JZU71_01945, partial [bacterium]|nr:hypothetical protein [bacterium]